MGHAVSEITIHRAPDDVWAVAGTFGDLMWMPGVESCEVSGDDRTLKLMGMTVIETLRRRDDATRTITYSITGGDLSVESHEATIEVQPDGDGSRVTWAVDVLPDSLVEVMRGAYDGALKALKAKLEA